LYDPLTIWQNVYKSRILLDFSESHENEGADRDNFCDGATHKFFLPRDAL